MPQARNSVDRRERPSWESIRFAIRLGAIALLLIPVVQYAAWYFIATGSFDGILSDAFFAAADSLVDAFNLALTDPGRFILLLVLGTVTWWLAFGFPRRRKTSAIGRFFGRRPR